jgi:Holliday junction resolvasome RuvABC endonuclease subunit
MTRLPKEGLVLGFHPTSYGFGWAAFSGPLSLYDWGLHHAKKRKNATCLERLEKLLMRLEPQVIVLEAFEAGANRSARVVHLCRAVVALAMEQRIEVAIYTRSQIKACYGSAGARSRQEIAEAVARHFEELRSRLPKPRAIWDGPDRRMAIFDAAALAQGHSQLCASQLFVDLLAGG